MKSKFLKNKSFTIVECVFAIFVLSVISIYIISGINNFLKIQNENIMYNYKLSEIENVSIVIRSNIKMNKSIFSGIDTEKYDIKVLDLGELYNIKLFLKDEVEKVYEFYVSK